MQEGSQFSIPSLTKMAPSTKNGEAMEALRWYSQLQARKLGDDYVEGASEEDFNDKGGFEYLAIFLFLLATVFILCVSFNFQRRRNISWTILPRASICHYPKSEPLIKKRNFFTIDRG